MCNSVWVKNGMLKSFMRPTSNRCIEIKGRERERERETEAEGQLR